MPIKHFINGVPAVRVAEQHGISKNTFRSRLKYGWDLEKACTYKHMPTKVLSLKLGLKISRIKYLLSGKGYTRQELEAMVNEM